MHLREIRGRATQHFVLLLELANALQRGRDLTPFVGAVSTWFHTNTLWSYQSWDRFDRNAGAVFRAVG